MLEHVFFQGPMQTDSSNVFFKTKKSMSPLKKAKDNYYLLFQTDFFTTVKVNLKKSHYAFVIILINMSI